MQKQNKKPVYFGTTTYSVYAQPTANKDDEGLDKKTKQEFTFYGDAISYVVELREQYPKNTIKLQRKQVVNFVFDPDAKLSPDMIADIQMLQAKSMET